MNTHLRSARAIAAVFLLALACSFASAAPTTFGTRTFEIPAPEGYLPTSADLPAYFDYAQADVPPTNRLVEAYLDPADKAAIGTGNKRRLKRYFQLQTLREIDGLSISQAEFAAAMEQMNTQIVQASANAGMAELIERKNANLERAGADARVEAAGVQFEGVYRREPWGLFFTMRGTVQFTVEGSQQSATIHTAGALLLIDGQVVYLYANADSTTPEAKAWAQHSVSAWADAVQAANGSKQP